MIKGRTDDELPQLVVSAMAEGDSNILQAAAENIKEEQQRLKYLAFIQVAAVSAALCFSNLYVYTKDRTGPLKPAVDIVERIVTSVVRLVFNKYFDDPVQLLKLVNPNVDEFVIKIDRLVPPVIQQVSSEAISAAGVAGDLVNEDQSAGVLSTASGFINQVSSEAISAAQKAPGVAGGLASEAVAIKEEEQRRKYLAVVQVTAVHAVLCFTNLYLYAKERSGPLKPGVEFVERMVRHMLQLVYDKYFDDPKVGEFLTKIDGLVPPVIRHVSSEAISAAQKAAGVAEGVSTEVQHVSAGLMSAASGFIKPASPEATLAVQKAPGVAEGLATEVERAGVVAGSVTKIDSHVSPVLKQFSSEAISAAQTAPGVAESVTTEFQHAGVLGNASGFIKQESSEAILAVQKAPGVAGNVATLVQHSGVVGEPVTKIDDLVPSVIKQVSSEAVSAAQKAPAVAAGVATEVQHAGVANTSTGFLRQVSSEANSASQQALPVSQGVATELQHAGVVSTASGFAKSIAKGLYTKYEPKAEQYTVSTWRKLNHLPLFPQVASLVVPAAAYFTDKYNQTVVSRAEKGYKVASYLPLVPTEKIAKVFSEVKHES